MSGTACYWTRLSLVTLSYYLVLVYSAPADRLGERTFIDGLKEEDRKFVSDPSAQSDG